MTDIKITSKLNIPKAFWVLLGIALVIVSAGITYALVIDGEARIIMKENKKHRSVEQVEVKK